MINIAVEGHSDVETARAVVTFAGHKVGKVFPAGGVGKLDPKILKYNNAALFGGPGWVVFRDSDAVCPVELRNRLLETAEVSDRFQLRIAHSMTEAWLLADRVGFADYFKVSKGKIVEHPEDLPHAKRALLDLVGKHGRQSVHRGIVTVTGKTGPEYVIHLNEFAREHWNVEEAAANSPSLARALDRIRAMPSD